MPVIQLNEILVVLLTVVVRPADEVARQRAVIAFNYVFRVVGDSYSIDFGVRVGLAIWIELVRKAFEDCGL